MTLPFDDIFSADGSLDRPVLLSEKTQLLAIKALQIAEFRAAWSEMSDSEWDDLDTAIGEAHTEILTIVEAPGCMWHTLQVNRSTDLSLNTGETTITWQTGSAYDSGNPTWLTMSVEGTVILTAHFHITAGTVRSLTAKIVKNGGEIVGHYNAANDALTQRCTITTQDTCFVNDYYQLLVTVNSGSNFVSTDEPQFIATVIEA